MTYKHKRHYAILNSNIWNGIKPLCSFNDMAAYALDDEDVTCKSCQRLMRLRVKRIIETNKRRKEK